MHCPHCGSTARQEVKDTRTTSDGRIQRKRRCPKCSFDFTTIEQLSGTVLRVRKSDGRIVAFNREAIRRSLGEAAIRKYDPNKLEMLIDAVVAEVYPRAIDGIVDSSGIGKAVLHHFRQVEDVSQIRFALVHIGRQDRTDGRRGWNTADDFRKWLAQEYPWVIYKPLPNRLATVVKRDGSYEQFNRQKLENGISVAAKGRGSVNDVEKLAARVATDVMRALGDQPMVTSGQLAAEILRSLRRRDHIAYLRFASTTKRFRTPDDYEAEAAVLANLAMKQE